MSSFPFTVGAEGIPSPQTTTLSARRENLRLVLDDTLGNLARQMSTAAQLPAMRSPEMVSSGVAAVDGCAGGFPRGAITEISGDLSTGRTTLLLAALAAATRRGESCALIDATDGFDPHSAQASGVDLRRVLWIRCNGVVAEREGQAARFAANDFGGHDWVKPTAPTSRWQQRNAPLYRRLEQSLSAADLLLQGGGFGMVAMDLAGLPLEVARRVPMTSWFRFKRAVENTPASLLVLQTESLVQGCAALALRLTRKEIARSKVAAPSAANLLGGFEVEVEMLRSPSERGMLTYKKHPQRITEIQTHFSTVAEWKRSTADAQQLG